MATHPREQRFWHDNAIVSAFLLLLLFGYGNKKMPIQRFF
jgi:hypothetical protein